MAIPLVEGDTIQGMCTIHQVPNPASGAPQPAPPGSTPFSAALTVGVEPRVLIEGKAVAVAGSSGLNDPPHTGLYMLDPSFLAAAQVGKVVTGSPTVTAGGNAIATTSSQVTMCSSAPASPVPSVTTVTVA